MDSFKNLLEPERFPCMTKVWKPMVPTKKDHYLTPNELKQTVFKSPRIIELIKELSENDPNKQKELEKSIKDMLNEIGLARSMPIIRWSGICLNAIFKRILNGIYVNEDSVRRIKEQMGYFPFLYLPSHRSYADFILMSYICFAYEFEIPGIAAGMDFYHMIGLGNLLRNTGAFFMRRSFSNDKLYWNVFKEYMRSLVNSYHTGVEFFVEGTRSRSLKALMPKVGLLSMALEPLYFGEVSDITIVPVGVAYEKPLEEQLFAYELLGVPKPKESTLGFFKALQILDQNFGNMYINFGEPISVRKYLGDDLDRLKHSHLPVHVQHLSKDELSVINQLAHHIVACQQKLIVLAIFNLVSTYFNYRMYIGEKTSLDQLAQGVLELRDFVRPLGAITAVDHYNVKDKILDSLNIHSNILQIDAHGHLELVKSMIVPLQSIEGRNLKGHLLLPNTVRHVVPFISLQLYCNPCMYWLVVPSFIILSIERIPEYNRNKENIITEVNKLKTIFSMEFIFEDDNSHTTEAVLDYLIDRKIIDGQTFDINRNSIFGNLFLSSMMPFLFCYYQVIETILAQFATIESFSEKELLIKVQEKVEIELNTRRDYVHPYCLSLDSISIALNALHANNMLEKSKTTPTVYQANVELLTNFQTSLLEYCNVLPKTNINHCFIIAKL